MRVIRLIISTILVLCALLVTFLVVQREFSANDIPRQSSISGLVIPDTLWEIASDPPIGSELPSAPVTIVEFYDYECTFCAEMQLVLDTIQSRYSKEIAIIYRHFPLAHHTGAFVAAIAAECAAEQDAFNDFHKLLFSYQAQLSGSVNWEALADKVRIEEKERFINCIIEQETASKIVQDTTVASMLGLEGVPTLIINGEMFYGAMDINEMETVIRDKLGLSVAK